MLADYIVSLLLAIAMVFATLSVIASVGELQTMNWLNECRQNAVKVPANFCDISIATIVFGFVLALVSVLPLLVNLGMNMFWMICFAP